MIIRVPKATDSGLRLDHEYAELVDLFPTIVEAALGEIMPPCPENSAGTVKYCTQGTSLVSLADTQQGSTAAPSLKPAAYSQYHRIACERYPADRAGACWAEETTNKAQSIVDGFDAHASACLSRACTMGYSVITRYLDGIEYRYTEWAGFAPDTGRDDALPYSEIELYNHSSDNMENVNIAAAAPKELTAYLGALLRRCGSAGCGKAVGATTTAEVAATSVGASAPGPATGDPGASAGTGATTRRGGTTTVGASDGGAPTTSSTAGGSKRATTQQPPAPTATTSTGSASEDETQLFIILGKSGKWLR